MIGKWCLKGRKLLSGMDCFHQDSVAYAQVWECEISDCLIGFLRGRALCIHIMNINLTSYNSKLVWVISWAWWALLAIFWPSFVVRQLRTVFMREVGLCGHFGPVDIPLGSTKKECLFFFLCWELNLRMLYYNPIPFYFLFWVRVLPSCPGWPGTWCLPSLASRVARITDVSHGAQPYSKFDVNFMEEN